MCSTNIIHISTETNDVPDFVTSSSLSTTLWFSGCNLKCEGCHNYMIKNEQKGFDLSYVQKELVKRRILTDWLVFLGGEPFNTSNSIKLMNDLVKYAKILGYNILVYTGYSLEIIKNKVKDALVLASDIELFFNNIEYVKIGCFDMTYDKIKYDKNYYFSTVNQYLYNKSSEKIYYYDLDHNQIINNV